MMIMVCDRCRRQLDPREERFDAEMPMAMPGPRNFAHSGRGVDLCPDCAKALMAWISAPPAAAPFLSAAKPPADEMERIIQDALDKAFEPLGTGGDDHV